MSVRKPAPRQSSPARHSRLRFLVAPFRRLWRWFSHQPRALQIGIVAVLLSGSAAGGYYARTVLVKRETARDTAAAWSDVQEAHRKIDLPAMHDALDRVLAANPDDPAATRYKQILNRGEADLDTPDLALLLMRHHLRAGRLTDAAREAEKFLAVHPKHWQARCTVARHALTIQKDPVRAKQILDLLPDPEEPVAQVTPGDVLEALSLFEAVGRDPTSLRKVIVRRVAPMMRSAAAASASPIEKRVLIACYLMPFVDRESLAQLAPYWAATDKLAEDAVNEAIAAGDVPTISRLAALGSPMRSALISLKVHEADRLTDDRFQALLKAIDDRTRRAWDAVREKKPNVPEVYLGLANLALVARDINGTIRELLEGIAACGERAELLIPLLQLMEQTQTADAVRPYAKDLLRSAETAKTDPEKWTLAALALVIADRSDLALQACAKARSIKPGHPWACGIEAQLWVRTGDFLKAREALAPLRDAARTDAFLTRLHARILIGCGLWVTRDDEFQKVLDAQAQVKAKSSGPAVAFLRGVLDAPVDGERAAWVAAKAELVLAGDPGATLAARVRAEALYRLAELSAAPHPKGEGRPPLWNAQRVAAALRAFDQLPLAERTEADVVVAIAVLQLKGEGSAAPALRTIDPLLPHEVTLNARQLEVVGAVLAANDRLDDAIRILNRSSVRSPSPSAGCRVALALAYHKNHQPDRARAALADADETPGRTASEQAELVAAKMLILAEKQ